MTLGDRERRWRKRGHLSFPPLLSESHSHRRAQLGKALGSGRPTPGVTDKETEAQKGGVTMAEWVGCGWQPRRGWSQPLGLFHLYPLPVSCWKGPGPGSPRSTKPAVLSTKEREGNWRLCPKAAHSGCQCPGRWTRAPGSPPPPRPGTSEGQHTRTPWGVRQRSRKKALHQSLPPAPGQGMGPNHVWGRVGAYMLLLSHSPGAYSMWAPGASLAPKGESETVLSPRNT